jgi:hypothetical protein
MADLFNIVPYSVRAAGTDVPPEEIQRGLNSLAQQTTVALNTLNTGESSNVNITGGTITGVTGATQSRLDNSLLLATDQFVNQQIASSIANVPFPLTGGVYNQASLGTGTSFVIFASGGVISSVITVVNGGTGYAVGDLLVVVGGNTDALLRVTNVSGGVIQSGGLSVLYGGTGYTTALTLGAIPVPPGQRSVTFTGVLTSNVTFIIQNGTFLTAARRIQVNNNTTGAFTVTAFLSNGLGGTTGNGVVIPQGTNDSTALLLQTDGMNDIWPSVNVLVGTKTNDLGAASTVGEYLTANATAVSVANATTVNAVSLSLTAGDWDVQGTAKFNPAGTTQVTLQSVGVTPTSLTFGGVGTYVTLSTTSASTGVGHVIASPTTRISLSATTTVFIVVFSNFTVSTMTVDSFIRARRVR